MAKASQTLARILNTIDRDTKRIKRLGTQSQLQPADALTLCRYASALDAIVKTSEKEAEKTKEQLKKLDTEALIAEYQKEQK